MEMTETQQFDATNAGRISLTDKEKRRLLVAGNLGSFLELFDFTVYSFFSIYIGQVFFNAQDPLSGLLSAVAVYAVGFIFRPLGSVVIGAYADRHGRKAALFLSIMLMGLGTSMIAFAPPYAMIGIAAPVILVMGRLLQGFSAGGQVAAAGSLLLESAPKSSRGFFISWQFIVQGFSALAGSLSGYLVTSFLTPEQVLSWGWRLPFMFCLSIVPIGFYIRAHLRETHEIKKGQDRGNPLKFLLSEQKARMAKLIMMFAPGSAVTYIMIFYMPNYLTINNLTEPSNSYFVSIYASVLTIFSTFLGGFVCDRVGARKPLIMASSIILFITCFLSFYYITNWPVFLVSYTISQIIYGVMTVAGFLFLIEGFPKHARATATGIIYACAVTLFGGGTSQEIVTLLISWSDKNLMAPFWYIGFFLVVGFCFALVTKEEHWDN